MRYFPVLLLLLLTASCGRPLTEAEVDFLKEIQGDTLDHSRVHLAPYSTVGSISRTYLTRPRTTCRELILPPNPKKSFTSTTAGLVAFNQIFLNPDWYLEDYLEGWPEELNLSAAMFLAHELTHVWQWQHRKTTRYHPLKGAAEHLPAQDPYLFDPAAKPRFLDYPYEHQASLVEEFVCCRALDPEGARTQRLESLVSQAMDPKPLSLSRVKRVLIPWEGAEIKGICS